jgi:ATP-binding cassette, subfamily B, bacterial
MSFETVARQTLYRQVRARGGDLRSLADRKLLGRIWRFAGRHHRRLGVGRGALGVVVALAAVIAAIAVAEAGISLVTRWLSSNIGEGLILDLRTAVFDHVQRMPVAFFTRTGALVSRLGNDQLMARGGRYAELYETQFGSQPDPEDVVAA